MDNRKHEDNDDTEYGQFFDFNIELPQSNNRLLKFDLLRTIGFIIFIMFWIFKPLVNDDAQSPDYKYISENNNENVDLLTYDSETAKNRYEILMMTSTKLPNKSFELDSKISIGTKDNFEDLVALGRHLAMFYLPDCNNSQQIRTIFNDAARVHLQGELIAVDCDQQKDFCKSKNIVEYPTIRVYDNGNIILEEFNHTANNFVKTLLLPISDVKQLEKYETGVLKVEFDNFTQFAADPVIFISPPVYIQGFPWKIYISISTAYYYQALNFYLKNSATEECKLSTWTCDAAAVLRIHSQMTRSFFQSMSKLINQKAIIVAPNAETWEFRLNDIFNILCHVFVS
uniref:MATH domain-containing protein n=1 Tax=Acrobeloides nanus TaxID=290746 RepID=A0A914E454_9BILA